MMPIKRAPRKQHFTIIPNQSLEDASLSFKARGLLAYMLSKSDDWEFYETELANHSVDGKAAIGSALKELEGCGYLIRQRTRTPAGTLAGTNWIVYDTPQPKTDNREQVKKPENQQTGNRNADIPTFPPKTDFPILDKPTLDNRTLPSTDLTKTNITKTNTTTTTGARMAQPDPLKPLQDFWEKNGFGTMTQFLWQNFDKWVTDFKELGATESNAVALIIRGMQACVTAGADKRKYNYLSGILNRYADNRFTTVSAVDAAEAARQARMEAKKQKDKPTNPVYIDHDRDAEADKWEQEQAVLRNKILENMSDDDLKY